MKYGNMGTLAVIALGVGSMLGAGIFSLMGQAALMAGRYCYLSFALGGVVALFSALSYARLGSSFPSSGGILSYYHAAYPHSLRAAGLGLLYLITLLISVAMLAQAFGAYASGMLAHLGYAVSANVFSAMVLLLLGLLNMMGAQMIGRTEIWLVSIKLGIIGILLLAGALQLPLRQMAETPQALLASGVPGSIGLCFFAYAGFGMMANTAGNLAWPQRQLPIAIISAILLVGVIYVLLALVISGIVPRQELLAHTDTAVAEAAEPLLGSGGYLLLAFAALVATASAINACLFSILRILQALADYGEIGTICSAQLWRNGTWGYLGALLLCLVLSLGMQLGQTASVASAGFLMSYLAVYAAHWKLRRITHGSAAEILIGAALMAAVLVFFLISLGGREPILLLPTALLLPFALLLARLLRRPS